MRNAHLHTTQSQNTPVIFHFSTKLYYFFCLVKIDKKRASVNFANTEQCLQKDIPKFLCTV